jgi:hypothetical protein
MFYLLCFDRFLMAYSLLFAGIPASPLDRRQIIECLFEVGNGDGSLAVSLEIRYEPAAELLHPEVNGPAWFWRPAASPALT